MNNNCKTGDNIIGENITHAVIKNTLRACHRVCQVNIIQKQRANIESIMHILHQKIMSSQLTPPNSHNSHLSPFGVKHQKGYPNLEPRGRTRRSKRIRSRSRKQHKREQGVRVSLGSNICGRGSSWSWCWLGRRLRCRICWSWSSHRNNRGRSGDWEHLEGGWIGDPVKNSSTIQTWSNIGLDISRTKSERKECVEKTSSLNCFHKVSTEHIAII
jgi:hypothetical protein